MRALTCPHAQPQWKTLCMIKPQRVFLMQRMSSRGMALQWVGICYFFSSVYGALVLDSTLLLHLGMCQTTLCAVRCSCASSRVSLWLCAGLQVNVTRTRTRLHQSLLQRQTHSI